MLEALLELECLTPTDRQTCELLLKERPPGKHYVIVTKQESRAIRAMSNRYQGQLQRARELNRSSTGTAAYQMSSGRIDSRVRRWSLLD